ncbi:hypothetical protein BKA69DRAFT_1123284 [Paraphysoderma sedebokerense]|nr:hypothetical protein BKA69DRAFT_1123284 [Paraphysoderma sedebokerense]
MGYSTFLSSGRAFALSIAVYTLLCILCGVFVDAGVRNNQFLLQNHWERIPTPTSIRFAPNGRVFVSSKTGIIFSADDINSPMVQVGDVTTQVFNNLDRGLTAIAVDPNFPTVPHVYVLFSMDALINGNAPRWNDRCDTGVCEGSGGIGRLIWDPVTRQLGSFSIVLKDWCEASPTHSVGDIQFDQFGNLYATAGESAFFNNQLNFGEAPNSCPWGQAGNAETAGAMLSQFDGRLEGKLAVISQAELQRNFQTGSRPAVRIIGKGLRNPYRLAIDRVTNNTLVADVGFATWEEINMVTNPATVTTPVNFGWPCLEGTQTLDAARNRNFAICNQIYAGTAVTAAPAYQYHHTVSFGDVPHPVDGQSAITALLVYRGSNLPAEYNGAIIFADYTRQAAWAILPDPNVPLNQRVPRMLFDQTNAIVDMQVGPDGAIYICQIWAGVIQRYSFLSPNTPPAIVLTPDRIQGAVPLAINFNSAGTYDPLNSGPMTYEWDLDGSNTFNGPRTPTAQFTYNNRAAVTVSLRVTSTRGNRATATVRIFPGYSLTANLAFNVTDGNWAVGDYIGFTGSATIESGAQVAASQYKYDILISHCYPGPPCQPDAIACHQHIVNNIEGASSGVLIAPDHEFPSYTTFQMSVTHPTVPLTVQVSRNIIPRDFTITITSNPAGLLLLVNQLPCKSPCVVKALANAAMAIETSIRQMMGNHMAYQFNGWSNGGSRAHTVFVRQNNTVVTANFSPITIPMYPNPPGQLTPPSAPVNVVASGQYQKCTVFWGTPTTLDPTNALVGYVIYYKEVMWGISADSVAWNTFYTDTAVSSWDFPELDIGTTCMFRVAAVTSYGESVSSPVASALTLLNPPPGVTICPDEICTPRSVLIEDFNDWDRYVNTGSNHLFKLYLQAGGFTQWVFNQDGKLVFQPNVNNPGLGYWYALLSDITSCFDGSKFTHIQFRVTAPAGSTFSVSVNGRTNGCTDVVAANPVRVTNYVSLDGTEKFVRVPLADISTNLRGLTSIVFNQFTVGQAQYLFDDLSLVNNCAENDDIERPVCTTTLWVDDFSDPHRYLTLRSNLLGGWTTDGGTMNTLTSVSEGFINLNPRRRSTFTSNFAAAGRCIDLRAYTHLNMTLTAPAGSNAVVRIQYRDATCTTTQNPPPSTVGTFQLSQFVMTGSAQTISIPLADLRIPAGGLANAFSLSIDSFNPANSVSVYRIDDIFFFDQASCRSPCQRLLVEDFGNPARVLGLHQNRLGQWTSDDQSAALQNVDGSFLNFVPAVAGSWFYSNFRDAGCFDASAYTHLRVTVAAPAGSNFMLALSQNCPASNVAANQTSVNWNTLTTPDGTAQTVVIPFTQFNVNRRALASVIFSGFTPSNGVATYRIGTIELVTDGCTVAPPASNNSGTCTEVLVDDYNDAQRVLSTVNLLGFNTGDGGSATNIAFQDGMIVITPRLAGTWFWSNLVNPNACFDARPYSHLSFRIRARPGTTVNAELTWRLDDCTTFANEIRIPISNYVTFNNTVQQVLIPLSDYATRGAVLNRIASVVFIDFLPADGSVTFAFDDVKFVSSACVNTPPSNTTTISTAPVPTTSAPTTSTATTTQQPTATTTPCAPEIIVNDFQNLTQYGVQQNNLGLWNGDGASAAAVSIANGILNFRPRAGSWWASIVAGTTCRNLSDYENLSFQISAAAGANVFVGLSHRTASCGALANKYSVPVNNYVTLDGTMKTVFIPIADFVRLGYIPARAHSVFFDTFTPNTGAVTFRLDNIRFVPRMCNAAPPAAGCNTGVVDDFNAARAQNLLGYWFGAGNMQQVIGNGILTLTPATGAWWATNTASNTACFDASMYSHLSFRIQAPAGASFTVELQNRDATCAANSPVTSFTLALTRYATMDGTMRYVNIPLADFVALGANLRRVSAIAFIRFTTLNVAYQIDYITFATQGCVNNNFAGRVLRRAFEEEEEEEVEHHVHVHSDL